jgi:hypothetical protein
MMHFLTVVDIAVNIETIIMSIQLTLTDHLSQAAWGNIIAQMTMGGSIRIQSVMEYRPDNCWVITATWMIVLAKALPQTYLMVMMESRRFTLSQQTRSTMDVDTEVLILTNLWASEAALP